MIPPEAPEYQSEPQVLSPVSPKPMHYPVPSNIPILEHQIDPVFNQTYTHMAEAAAQHPSPLHLDQASVAYSHHGQLYQPDQRDSYMMQPAGHQDGHGQPRGQGLNQSQGQAQIQGHTQQEQAQTRMHSQSQSQSQSQTNQDSRINVREGPFIPEHSATHSPSTSTATAAATASNAASSTVAASAPNAAPSTVAASAPYPTPTPTLALAHLHASSSSTTPHPYPHASSDHPPFQGHRASSDHPPFQGHPASAQAPTQANASELPPGVEASSLHNLINDLSQQQQHAVSSNDVTDAASASSSNVASNGQQAGLPPRPPPQEQSYSTFPSTHDIRDFHPHSQQPSQKGFDGNAVGSNGLPAPPVASFQQALKLESQRERKLATGEALDEDDRPWTADIQNRYDHFLNEERKYVTEGNWEQFPYGSRLFVGNLSSERVTKRDIFHVFHKYGDLAQISIKQAYGFVQFLHISSCTKAIQAEQGKVIRGKKIHLEVSKPQKNRIPEARPVRRSRSPDRAANSSTGPDRYLAAERRGERDRERNRRPVREHRRSPSPRSPRSPRSYRARDRSRDRSRDRREQRHRSRSRSPAYGRGRFRSPSPRRRNSDDDLPLPRRAPRDVPDVQIIVLDDLDRNFIAWLEHSFTLQGIRVDVLLLSPRLSEAAVVRRQILEGVLAVSRITRVNQQTAKISLQVFDRRAGIENVRFDEYDNLDPTVAAQLVLRAKAAPAYQAPPVQYGYGAGMTAAPPNLTNLITSLDPTGLQKLLGVMQPPISPMAPHVPATALTPDLAKLLGNNAAALHPQSLPQTAIHSPTGYGLPQHDPLAALRNNPALASLLQARQIIPQLPLQVTSPQPSMPPSPNQPRHPPPPDMADILAKLGSYRR